jgi:hypothetical protein
MNYKAGRKPEGPQRGAPRGKYRQGLHHD